MYSMLMNSSSELTTRGVGRLLRLLRLRGGLEQHKLASMLGVSQPTISRWEAGLGVPSPAQAQAWVSACRDAVGDALAAEVSEAVELALRDGAAEDAAAVDARLRRLTMKVAGGGTGVYDRLIPYYADVAAGIGEAQEQRALPRQQLSVPREVHARDPGCYALRVSGDSMAPQLLDGDLVVVSPAAPLMDGCIVAAYIEPDGDVVKVYRELPGGAVVLQPVNPAYASVVLGAEDGPEARIWGRVVLSQREL